MAMGGRPMLPIPPGVDGSPPLDPPPEPPNPAGCAEARSNVEAEAEGPVLPLDFGPWPSDDGELDAPEPLAPGVGDAEPDSRGLVGIGRDALIVGRGTDALIEGNGIEALIEGSGRDGRGSVGSVSVGSGSVGIGREGSGRDGRGTEGNASEGSANGGRSTGPIAEPDGTPVRPLASCRPAARSALPRPPTTTTPTRPASARTR